MPTPGVPELLVILAIVLVLFGGKKLPGVFRSMGEGIKEFRKATESADGGDDNERSETGSEAS